jgi:hypothetical protein
VTVEDPRCEPLWNLNNWREVMSGQASRRVIRVLWVNRAIAAARAQPAQDQPQRERLLRTLELRLRRASGILGPEFVP